MTTVNRIEQGQLALSGSAQQLVPPATLAENTFSVAVRAHSANVGKVYVGKPGVTTSTGYELAPGELLAMDLNHVDGLYVVGTAADKVSWTAVLR